MKNKILDFGVMLFIIFMVVVKVLDQKLYNECDNMLGYLAIVCVILGSIYFTFKLKFLQLNLKKVASGLLKGNGEDLKALFMTLGSKIGVGNIVGITLAVYTCGAGVIFWIWVINLFSSILTYCETYLGCKYKIKNRDGYRGGSFYYIKNGLNNKGLALIYTVVLLFIYIVGFVGIQANSIVNSVTSISGVNNYIVSFVLVIIIGVIIFKSLDSVIGFVSKIVPIMCILYLVLGSFIIFFGDYSFIEYFKIVISDALRVDSALLGIMIVGLKRGIFATESGLGTSSIATSISDNSPENQGLFQILGVHFISFVVITITGFVVIGNSYGYVGSVNGIDIMMTIFNNYFGMFGKIGLTVIVLLFAVSTILGGYYYGVKGLEFIKNKLSSSDCLLFKVVVLIFLFLGSIVESSIIWELVDSLVLILLIINIYCMFKLRNEIE